MIGCGIDQGGLAVRGKKPVPEVSTVALFHGSNRAGTVDYTHSGHPAWPSSPDVTYKDVDGSLMAYHEISQQSPDDTAFWSSSQLRLRAQTVHGDPDQPTPNQITPLLWFDLDQIPANARIVSATIGIAAGSTSDRTNTLSLPEYGLGADLDTYPGNDAWLGGSPTIDDDRRRLACWNNAIGGGTPTPWALPPSLIERHTDAGLRADAIDWGNRTTNDPFSLDVTKAVQTYVCSRGRGTTNNGFWIINNGRGNSYCTLVCPKQQNAANDFAPFLVVEYTNKIGSLPWNGNAVAFNLQTDDQYEENGYNTGLRAVANAKGIPVTFFIRGDAIDGYRGYSPTPPGARPDKDEIQGWIPSASGLYPDLVNEIGHHTLNHDDAVVPITDPDPWTGGLALADDLADFLAEIDKDWLESDILEGAQSVTTIAYPGGTYNDLIQQGLASAGFLSARGVNADADPHSATYGQTTADDPLLLRWTEASNLFAVRATDVLSFVSAYSQAALTEAEIKRNAYRVANQHAYDDNAAISFFTHDQRAVPDQGTYTNGIDLAELGYVLDTLGALGWIWFATYNDLVAWYRAAHQPTDPPSGSIAETNGIVAADGIWWGPPS